MPNPAEKPRLGEIYREQYQEVSSSKASRAFRWITPVGLLVIAVLGVVLGHGSRGILEMILGALFLVIVLIGVVMYLIRRRRLRQ